MQCRFLALLTALVLMISCKSKNISDSAVVPEISKSSLYKKNLNVSFQNADITTLKIDAKLNYKDAQKSQKIGLKIRLEKGEKIWMSGEFLGLPIAKLLIENDSVFYYNKFDKTYFKGSFDFIHQLIGTQVNYTTLEQLLLGDLIIPNKKFKSFDLEIKDNAYFITDKKSSVYTKQASIYPLVFKTKQQSIYNQITQSLFQASYKSHQAVDGFLFPKKMEFTGTKQNKNSFIYIEYQDIVVNTKLGFPFKIPSSCNKQIVIPSKTDLQNAF
ncbi:DUF4292 domain-containing protein [Ochrovirga pacifica]|uniref:DUF4292 domain-containing protein n=1 Tax=Ochrovirga pacifica TaxID=1042376 RepID=UPI0002558AB1|nr:DUF4292 domain-containing protein [Ochrovirga pacifica]